MASPKGPERFTEQYIIVGGGPVGLLAALLLAKERRAKVAVYELRDAVPDNPKESYPIGLNPRGVRAMDRVNRDIALGIRTQCHMVDGWQGFAGTRNIFETQSGLVIGTTRSLTNSALYDETLKADYRGLISVHWGYRLKDIDFLHRHLVFEHAGKEVEVDGSGARLLAADGVRSEVRRLTQEKYPELITVKSTPWGVAFRLLYSKPRAKAPGLDPRFHYILGGVYTSIIQDDVWVVALGIKTNDSDHVKDLLMSDESTDANRAALRRYVTETAPLAAPLLTEDELAQYFSRRSFTGSIIKMNQLNLGEWICFLGDAAHSVIPPTGEGFNSGAEDVEVLLEALRQSEDGPLSRYSELRLPDVHALHDLAMYLNAGNFTGAAPERKARLMATILISLLKKCRLYRNTYEDLTFGSEASPPRPYRDIISMWKWQKFLPLLLSRLIIYPIFLVIWTITIPYWVPVSIFRKLFGRKRKAN